MAATNMLSVPSVPQKTSTVTFSDFWYPLVTEVSVLLTSQVYTASFMPFHSQQEKTYIEF